MSSSNFDINNFVTHARKIKSDTTDVEVKTCAKALSKDITETLSAFANCSGGVIVCGLSEKDNFAPVEGFDVKKISEAISQVCADKMEPPIRANISTVEFENSIIVVAKIPETEPFQKPCYIKNRGPYEGSFVREGEGDRKLSRYEVDRLTEERTQPKYDALPVENAQPVDLDPELVSGFLQRERAASPRIFAGLSEEDALLTMGVLTYNGAGIIKPTLAGLMALGRHPQKYFPRANVTFAMFPGTSKEHLATNGVRFLDSRTIIGPIPMMVAETLAAVRRNMKVLSRVEGGARLDTFEYPEVAVREAVANALMHRDYSPEGVASQVQVNMFQDRIEVISPGGLYGIVTVDNIGTYGTSSSRNQYLSRILESAPYPAEYPERGYVVENKGTGYAQIQASLKAQGMPPAKPVDSLSVFVLTMRKSEKTATTNTALPEVGSTSKISSKLSSDAGQTLINAVQENGSISKTEASELLGTSGATAYRRIKELIDAGALVVAGKQGRSTRYKLAN